MFRSCAATFVAVLAGILVLTIGLVANTERLAHLHKANETFDKEEFMKGRRSRGENFQWFAGELVECVAGKRIWGRNKYFDKMTGSRYNTTRAGGTAENVTVGDEAFTLLMVENYIEKWRKLFDCDQAGTTRPKRLNGKYTSSTAGHGKYKGWSDLGIQRYNEIVVTVVEDRKIDKFNDGVVESAVLKVLQESEAGQRVTKREDVRSAKKQKSPKSTRAYNTMPSGFDAPG